jgi:hypothetical protein
MAACSSSPSAEQPLDAGQHEIDTDLWEAMNSPRERARIERARPLGAAA